jgi:hypothetical protein
VASTRVGISHGGKFAEERFRELTGASKAARSGDGDAILNGIPVEVKNATKATLNQVRAVKYIPLVAYYEPADTWYVVPAHVIVCLVSTKVRGQHTENPFESATLNIFALSKYRVASEKNVKQATLAAIAASNTYPDLKRAMERVLRDSKELAAKSVRDVSALVTQLKIIP